jgi:hypothetical protein
MFQAPKLTNAGKALYYENVGGVGITFTVIKMGKGTLNQPIATLTDLIDPVMTIDASLSNASGNYVDISGSFTNSGLTEGFYWKEIGVFAADPDHPDDRTKDILFCYQNAYDTADFIPAASIETVEKHVTVPLIVGDATNVSCILDSSLVYVTKPELDSHTSNTTAHITSSERTAWNNKVDKATGTLAFTLGRDANGIYIEY